MDLMASKKVPQNEYKLCPIHACKQLILFSFDSMNASSIHQCHLEEKQLSSEPQYAWQVNLFVFLFHLAFSSRELLVPMTHTLILHHYR